MNVGRPRTVYDEIMDDMARFFSDPLGYTFYAWDWGNTPALKIVKMPEPWASRYDSEYGLDGWACELFEHLAEDIKARNFDPMNPSNVMPIDYFVRSGHGIGKSCLTGILVSFLLDTRPGSQGTVTANTGTQLFTKTWPQIKKWKETAITAQFWRILTNKVVSIYGESEGLCSAITWDAAFAEAFQGQHAIDASSFYINDEASAINDLVLEAQEGGMTDGEPMRFSFSNPTRNTGYFHKAFGRDTNRIRTYEIDSRTVQITNKELIAEWAREYGEDSDFFRVRVRGKEPRMGEKQLIGSDIVRAAMVNPIPKLPWDEPISMGIDVARSLLGDESVIRVRRGKDARTFGQRVYRGLDTHQLASRAAEWCDELRSIGASVDGIFVDGGGLGAGTYDRLVHLGYPAHEVLFGGRADNPVRFKQKDAEMWQRMKAWLQSGGVLERDVKLEDQLCGRPYDHTDDNRMYIWPKDKIRDDLHLESPDRADALALTFAFELAPKERFDETTYGNDAADHDYDPLAGV